jgi:hypothetical protein
MGERLAAMALVVVNFLVWGAPAALYSYLALSACLEGQCLIFWLVLIGPGSYLIGLALSTALPTLLLRRGRAGEATVTAALLLLIGVPWCAWGILMLGST